MRNLTKLARPAAAATLAAAALIATPAMAFVRGHVKVSTGGQFVVPGGGLVWYPVLAG